MPIKLYITDVSPAVRGTLLLAKALDLNVELVQVNLAAGENLTPAFLKLNPQHTVPTLEDDDFAIWDSHAINIYLVEKYAKDDSLYPKDAKKRAVINQRLFFDAGVLFPTGAAIVGPIIRQGVASISKEQADRVLAGYELLEAFLEGKEYVAGDFLSIADLSVAASASTGNVLVPITEDKFPNVSRWLNRMKSLPFYKEGNQDGLDKFTWFIKSKLAENAAKK